VVLQRQVRQRLALTHKYPPTEARYRPAKLFSLLAKSSLTFATPITFLLEHSQRHAKQTEHLLRELHSAQVGYHQQLIEDIFQTIPKTHIL